MRFSEGTTLVIAPLLGLVLIAALAVVARAQQPSPVDLVDALNGLFGKHAF